MLKYCVWHGLKGKISRHHSSPILICQGPTTQGSEAEAREGKGRGEEGDEGPDEEGGRDPAQCHLQDVPGQHEPQQSRTGELLGEMKQSLATIFSFISFCVIELHFPVFASSRRCYCTARSATPRATPPVLASPSTWSATSPATSGSARTANSAWSVRQVTSWDWSYNCLGSTITITNLLQFATFSFPGSCWWGQDALLRPLWPRISHLLRWTQSDPQR